MDVQRTLNCISTILENQKILKNGFESHIQLLCKCQIILFLKLVICFDNTLFAIGKVFLVLLVRSFLVFGFFLLLFLFFFFGPVSWDWILFSSLSNALVLHLFPPPQKKCVFIYTYICIYLFQCILSNFVRLLPKTFIRP